MLWSRNFVLILLGFCGFQSSSLVRFGMGCRQKNGERLGGLAPGVVQETSEGQNPLLLEDRWRRWIFFSKGDGIFRWVAVICTNQFSRFSHWESILFTSQFEELLTGATGEQHVNSVAEITSRVHQILRNYPQSLSQSSIHHWSGWMKIRHQQKNRWCWDSPNPNHHLWGCKTLMSLWFLPRLMATSNHKGFVKKCFPCR